MAKRRRLEVPNLDALGEGQGAPKLPNSGLGPMSAPIAKVASETATTAAEEVSIARVKAAEFERDAKAYNDASEKGLIAAEIDIALIDDDYLARDREFVAEEALIELRNSIAVNGLRYPIEVTKLGDRYGLISGWRRLQAVQMLVEDDASHSGKIAALLRNPAHDADAYIAMIEENEMRENPSPYERGRVVQLAVDLGVMPDLDAAVVQFFGQASKAKRSKIRSFALLFRELGTHLRFGFALGERAGLTLAKAIKQGQGDDLRTALKNRDAKSPDDEWRIVEEVLKSAKVSRAKPASEVREFNNSSGVSGKIEISAKGIKLTARTERERFASDLEAFVQSWT